MVIEVSFLLPEVCSSSSRSSRFKGSTFSQANHRLVEINSYDLVLTREMQFIPHFCFRILPNAATRGNSQGGVEVPTGGNRRDA
jgi:hypothetical protein